MKFFNLPDIGEGLQESEIVSWHVSPGDHVVSDQPLVSVETDKAIVELPSPVTATVSRLCALVGDVVPVGAPLVEFKEGEDDDGGAIVGELGRAEAPTTKLEMPEPAGERNADGIIRATPAVRAHAKKLGVSLTNITGSGPDGAISRADVDAARVSTSTSDVGFEPVRGPRRAMATNMAHAGATVVPATVTDLAEITTWSAPDADISSRAITAIIRAVQEEPALNAWFEGETPARKLHDTVDVGLAVDAPDGLFVPVVRSCESIDAGAIRTSIDDLAARARERTLTPEDLRDPTITLSNFGGIGGRHASLIVRPPQVAIVGIGQVERGVALRDGQVSEVINLPISLTFDHRAVTGGEATRFLAAFKSDLERSTQSAKAG